MNPTSTDSQMEELIRLVVDTGTEIEIELTGID
jgi:hypothetical protein